VVLGKIALGIIPIHSGMRTVLRGTYQGTHRIIQVTLATTITMGAIEAVMAEVGMGMAETEVVVAEMTEIPNCLLPVGKISTGIILLISSGPCLWP
jgi:hypothetical protein